MRRRTSTLHASPAPRRRLAQERAAEERLALVASLLGGSWRPAAADYGPEADQEAAGAFRRAIEAICSPDKEIR